MRYLRIFLSIIFFLIWLSATYAFAAENRGLRVIAKDPASGQQGEVRLYNKSYAVIIGIDRYQNLPADRQLQNAVKDAKGVEDVLRKNYQFDKIITMHNEQATRDHIMEVLTEELPAYVGKDDALFLFWAGHGNQEKNDYGEIGYLIPYDGATDKIRKNITMAKIRDTISKKIPAKHIFYVMDACYSGLLTTRAVEGKSRRDLGYLKEITKESVRQVLTAGSKGEEALDGGPKGNSVFTGRFIEILATASDFITANELQANIKEKVHSDASARNHTQTPSFGALSGLGDFVFIPKHQDRLGDLIGTFAEREKELEQLRKVEEEASKAKRREQTEIKRKEKELATLDKQIAELKGRLGTSATHKDDNLDQIITKEQKTFYSLGVHLNKQISVFDMSPEELKYVQQGMSDVTDGRTLAAEPEANMQKLGLLAQSRMIRTTEKQKGLSKVFLEEAATERGAQKTASGMIYTEIKAGTGAKPKAKNFVKVHYIGTLIDGKEFDSSVKRGQPAEFPLDKVIPCWSEGVGMMKAGGKAKLICPSNIAYGDQGRPPVIPGGATLIFEVELLDAQSSGASIPKVPTAAKPGARK